jgi:HSP20 family molecular chaperone IbpA
MALVRHGRSGTEGAVERRPDDLFETSFSDWPSFFRRPFIVVPEGIGSIRSDEFMEDDTLVARIEIAGIDPERDVEVSLDGDVLHISAERREEEETKERDYTRRELRLGSFRRDVLVPAGPASRTSRQVTRTGSSRSGCPPWWRPRSSPPPRSPSPRTHRPLVARQIGGRSLSPCPTPK